jgi:hypothetical protein
MLKKYSFVFVLMLIVSPIMAQNVPSYVPKDGLIGWWPFNGNANDESGNGINGTVKGATLAKDRNGKVNSAYSFDGKTNAINLPAIATSKFTNQFTFSGWINVNENTDHQSIYLRQGADYTKTWILKMAKSNEIRVYNENSNYASSNVVLTNTNHLNQWFYLNVTISGKLVKVYINGKKIHEETIGAAFSWTNSMHYFGFSGNTGNQPYPFIGTLDDIAIFNRAITDQEVTALYNGVNECANFTASIISEGVTSICKGSQVKLKTTSGANNTYQWYYYSQPIVGAKDSIYKADTSGAFSVKITNAKNCVAQSASINVSVLDTPLLNTYDQVFCDTGKVQLCVKSNYDTISWYDEANKSKLLYKGSCFQTSLTTSKTFLVQANNGSCTSSFMPISAIIKTSPIIAKSSDAALCEYGSAVISATPSKGIINWYSENIGGKIVGTGLSFTTPQLATSTTYYAEAVNDGCISKTRKPVNVFVNASYIQYSDTVVCYGSSVELKAPGNTFSKTNYNIGEVGPSGGYIFYDQGSEVNGWRYLEVTPKDVVSSNENSSGCYCTTINNTSAAIGSGSSNTKEWENAGCPSAAKGYSLNGFSDWFVPSKDELNQIYLNLKTKNIGGFADLLYWSSTPDAYGSCGINGGVAVQNFTDGKQLSEYRNGYQGSGNLRLIRSFTGGTSVTNSTYKWNTGDTTQSINPIITKYTDFWVDITTNGITCRKFVTIKLNKQPIQFEKIAGELVQTACPGEKLKSVEFKTTNVYKVSSSANSPKNFWSNLYNDQLSIYIGSMDLPGEYPFYITLKGACDSVNIYMKLITNPAPKANILPGGTVNLCTGNTAKLTAEGGSKYLWNTGATSASIDVVKGGGYYVQVTNEFGCSSGRDISVSEKDKPYVRIDSLPTMLFKSNPSITLYGSPTGGIFEGAGVLASKFNPKNAGLGKKKIRYSYTSKEGCSNSITQFLYVVDSINSECTFVDTITVTNKVTIYDTVKVTKFDTITITNKVTTYDTVTVKNNVYDTVTITNKVTKYDTIMLTDTVSILKIKFKLTTGLQANKMASMSLYPNPTTDVLHIEVGDAKVLEGYRYRILDALGKEVYNELVKNANTEIPLKSLGAAGMYQFEVLDQKNVRIQANKIVLQ